MRAIALDVMQRGLSVCLCLFVTSVSYAKMAEPIMMPFGETDVCDQAIM